MTDSPEQPDAQPQDGSSEQPDFGSRTDFYTFAPESLADVLPAFEIRSEVGKGSMGIVYDALVRADGRRVALKVLPPSLTLTERALARFTREGEIMSKIRHPGIVEVYDHGRRDRLHYFVMEFVEGVNLEDRLTVGPMPPMQAAEICAQVARALHYAHDRGVVHRDVKPSNLILRADDSVVVTDFGLARETGTGSMTESGAIVGTPMFMAPEQITGDRTDITSRIDVYGLGATLFTLVTGQPPFQGPTAQKVLREVLEDDPPRPSKLTHGVPRPLEAIILTALAKEPTRRYATAAAFGEDLERFLRGEPVQARLPGPGSRALNYVRKRPLTASLATLVLLLTAVAWWLFEVRKRDELDAELSRAARLVAQAVSVHDDQLRPLDATQRRTILTSAISTADGVLDADPSIARAWFVRAQAHYHLRRYRDAWKDLDRAEAAYAKPMLEVLHYRIDALTNIPGEEARTQLFRDLRTLIEVDSSPYNRCIVAFHLLDLARSLEMGDRDALLDRASDIVDSVPEPDEQVAVIRARILELRGLHELAIEAARAATVQFHGKPIVHEEAAAMFHRRGLVLEGEEQAELARIIAPSRAGTDFIEEAETAPPPDLGELQSFLRDLQELLRGEK